MQGKAKSKKVEKEMGIRFQCQDGCTKCCAIPGQVFVHKKEIPEMAKYFKLSEPEFIKKHLHRHLADLYQFNFPDSEPCVFLTEKGCEIYEVRPVQCRTYPFWPENMASMDEWEKQEAMCPGIGVGRLYSVDEITDIMAEVSYGPFI